MLRVLVHEFAILHPEDGPRRALRAFAKASHNRRECGQGFAPACEPPHATATVALLRPPARHEAHGRLRRFSPDFANFSSLLEARSITRRTPRPRSLSSRSLYTLRDRAVARKSRVNSTWRTIDLPYRVCGAISPVERRWKSATVGRDVSYLVNGCSTESKATHRGGKEKRWRSETRVSLAMV